MAAKVFRQMFEEKYIRFPGGRTRAFTLSYDDGVEADRRLLKIIDKYGLRCTFNLNSTLFDCAGWHGRMDEEATYNAFKDGPHEVALHGARHIFLNKVPLPEAIREVALNRDWLEHKFGRIVCGMAYAYNGFNDDVKRVLKDLGVHYARTTTPTHSFALPSDFLEWDPTCHHSDPLLAELAEQFVSTSPADEFKHREGRLFYVWGHSYEYDDNDNWHILEGLAQKVSGNADIWYATNGEIYDYVAAYRALVFSLDGERVFNPSYMPVWLEIRGKTYRVGPGESVLFDAE